MKILFFDLETTGVKYWRNGIHQISGILDIDGRTVETFDFKVRPNPAAEVEPSALEVARISAQDLENYPPMAEIYARLIKILDKYVDRFDKSDKMYLAGFNNAGFDNPFLKAFFEQSGNPYFFSYFWPNPIDVYVLASWLLMADRPNMANFKLVTAARKLGIQVDESRLHDARYDVELTREIFYRVCDSLRPAWYTPRTAASASFIPNQDDGFLLPFDKDRDLFSPPVEDNLST